MSNPHDYREIMSAIYGFSGRDVDEVLAEQKERHRKAMDEAKSDARANRVTKFGKPAQAPAPGTVRKSQLDALGSIVSRAKQLQEAKTK